MKSPTQFTRGQRYPIDAYRKAGLNPAETVMQLAAEGAHMMDHPLLSAPQG